MKPDQRAEVLRLAADAGVPTELFEGWVGEELAIHPEPATPAAAGSAGKASPKQAGREDWTLSLGAQTHRMSSAQAEALKSRLTAAGIAFATFPLTHDYLQRKGEE